MKTRKDELVDLLREALTEERPQQQPEPKSQGIDPLLAIALVGVLGIGVAIASYPATVGNGVPVQQGGSSGVTAR